MCPIFMKYCKTRICSCILKLSHLLGKIQVTKFKIYCFLFTIFPLAGCMMDETKQFISVYRLWIEVVPNWVSPQIYVGLIKNSQDLLKGTASHH